MSMTITMTQGMMETARIKQLVLPQDTISLEQNEYSENLRDRVRVMVRNELRHAHDVYTTDCTCNDCINEGPINSAFTWETTGTKLHKRVKSHVFRRFQVQLSDTFLRSIADLAAAERNQISRIMDATTAFTWKPGDFGDPKSCFFNQYRMARLKYLPMLGTSAIRTYNGEAGDGRYWIFPLPILNATYRSEPLYVAFNGYGTLKNSKELYLASMVKAVSAKWGRAMATTNVNLEMSEVYVNGDERCTLVHPADMDAADFARTISDGIRTSSEPLRYDRWNSRLMVSITDETYSRVGLPVPSWAKWADGRYCRDCDNWDYIENIRFYSRRPYCAECFRNHGWGRSERDPEPAATD
jgi:hypothetical protein